MQPGRVGIGQRVARIRRDRLLEQAIAADPGHALAYTYTAWLHVLRIAQGWASSIAAESEAAARAAAAAMERDRRDALALAIRGHTIGYVARDFAAAAQLLDQAVAVRPSCALAWTFGGALHSWRDDGELAVRWAERGLRLAPRDPFAFFHEHVLAQAHYAGGNFAQAIEWSRRAEASNPLHAPTLRTLVASLVAAGRSREVAAPASRLVALDPGFRLRAYAERTPLRGAARDLFIGRLRQAGLPD